ncbi:MAG TPA: preprotein translocase subunit YajC [Geminicoccaceae bacterium]|nr:preprotein translocase subunit YajC [Geminicoccus sp.]HMU51333.1 preprotein translocase subunit YajC [Geminicoccaceae bacterium]
MLISPAYAQAAGPSGAFDFISLLPLVMIFVVFYFLLIRPQQKKMRDHRSMIDAIKKGDQVVTAGGIIGRVAKVEAGESTVMVEIAPNVQVKVARQTISDIVNKPATGNDNKPATAAPASGGMLSKLFKK